MPAAITARRLAFAMRGAPDWPLEQAGGPGVSGSSKVTSSWSPAGPPLYFFDPEDNRCEIYWGTGLQARQSYLEAVDLDRPKDEILRRVEESVRQHGRTGYSDPTIVRERRVLAHTKAEQGR